MRKSVLIANNRHTRYLFEGDQPIFPSDQFDIHLVTNDRRYAPRYQHCFDRITFTDFWDDDHTLLLCQTLAGLEGVSAVTSWTEKMVLPLAQVRAALNLPGMSLQTALNFRDKYQMRRALEAARLPVPAYAPVRTIGDIQMFTQQYGTSVLKPRLGVGSKGVTLVEPRTDLTGWQDRLASEEDHWMIEAFIAGDVLHCDSVVVDGKPVFTSLSRYMQAPGLLAASPCLASVIVQDPEQRARAHALAAATVAALGLERGTTHLEMFEQADGSWMICEIGARPGGAGTTDNIKRAYGVNLVKEALLLAGDPAYQPIIAPVDIEGTVGYVGLFTSGGIVSSIEVSEDLSWVEHVETFCAVGQPLAPSRHSADYTAGFTLTARDVDEFRERMTLLLERRPIRLIPG